MAEFDAREQLKILERISEEVIPEEEFLEKVKKAASDCRSKDSRRWMKHSARSLRAMPPRPLPRRLPSKS